MALNVTLRGRRRLNASIGIGRIEVDDVAQKNLAVVKLITPDADSLKCKWAFTKPRHHSLATGLDALGDCNFTFTRKETHRAHVAEIDAKWVIGFRRSLAGLRSRNRSLPDHDRCVLGLGCLTFSLDVGVTRALDHAHA